MQHLGKCAVCGEFKRLIHYNGNSSCAGCLSMDKRGISRMEILDIIQGKGYDKPRRNWKKHRRSSR